jgi:uncharacterized protein YutE (UPF0331/DUF86 family)
MSPGRIDSIAVRRHMFAIDEALTELARHAGQEVDVLDRQLAERWAVERGLQLCVQGVLDIATHIAAGHGRDTPDYTSAIDELGRLGVIPVELAGKLRPLAGFRNVLVHGYLKLETRRVHAVLNDHLDEIRAYVAAIDAYLNALD